MRIRIDVQHAKANTGPEPTSVVFGTEGGTIGRSSGSGLVLPGEDISRTHAVIGYENGRYHLLDTSRNGTLLCYKDNDLLVLGDKVELADGDSFRIGDYILRVTITREVSPKTLPIPDTPSIASFEFEEGAPEGAQSIETPAAEEIEPVLPEQGLSIDDLFSDLDVDETIVKPGGGPRESTPHEVPIAAALPDSQGRLAVVVEPVIDVPAESTPEAPVRVAAGEPRRSEREAYRELFSLFLKGARVDDASFLGNEDIGEMMENLGAIFREMADGLWTILRGRTETKAEVRVAVTVVRPDGNNPLKMSPGADDVLRHLLKRQHRGFLEPVDAVREGIEDIINHQLAMNAGIKASLIEALDRFDPRHFEEKSTQWLASQRKIRCWNEYAEAYGRLKEEAFEGFFGKAFVRAYEEQLDKLRSKLKKR